MACVYLFFRNIAQRSGNRNRSIKRRGGARSRWGWVRNAIWGQSVQLMGGARGRASIAWRHGSLAGTLARPYTHAGTSAHAPHAEDIDSNLFQGLGFMVCVYLFFRNVAQGSDYTMPSVQAYIRVLFSHGMIIIMTKYSLTVYLGLGFVSCVLRKAATTQCLRCRRVSESSKARNDTNNY